MTVSPDGSQTHLTIQSAIEESVDGDEIVVFPATYFENVNFNGKSITLRSTNPGSSDVVTSTIIDANHDGRPITFSGSETTSTQLLGFTIQNGDVSSGQSIGGGISQCHGWIHNNSIMNNLSQYGGGLYQCNGTIEQNLIEGNIVGPNTYYRWGQSQGTGGGLLDCDGLIQNNLIVENEGANGGGLRECDGIIRFNLIEKNQANGINAITGINQPNGHGGGLYRCNALIENNLIIRNSSTRTGGGISSSNSDLIQNNIIAENIARGAENYAGNFLFTTGSGGGMYNCEGTIQNNLIYLNKAAGSGAGMSLCRGLMQNNTIAFNTASDPVRRGGNSGGIKECTGIIRNCIIWGNDSDTGTTQIVRSTTPTFSCIMNWTGGGEGNISSDPRLLGKKDLRAPLKKPFLSES